MDWCGLLARHAAQRTAAVERRGMARGLAGLATVAATAPLAGVVGTLAGVVHLFAHSPGCFGVGPGELAEPCWIAAFGLAVGIAAWWGYRYLSARMAGLDLEMWNAAHAVPEFRAASRAIAWERSPARARVGGAEKPRACRTGHYD